MNLDNSQKQLLVIIYGLVQNDYPADLEMIQKAGRSFFQDGLLDLDQAFVSLLADKVIAENNGVFTLSADGERMAALAMQQIMEGGTEKGISRYAKSVAYHQFCSELHGIDLGQLNMLSRRQLDDMLDFLDLKAEHFVLDLGCGNGYLSEYLADESGAFVLGIDSAKDAIEEALSRTVAKKNSLDFVSRDFNVKFVSSQKFDVIIAVDSLYQVVDLEGVVANLQELLTPDGKMAIFYSDRVEVNPIPQSGLADHTRLAVVLQKLGIEYQSTEFSEEEFVLWNNILELEPAYREQFAKEDNQDLLSKLAGEADLVLKNFDITRVRFLYKCSPKKEQV